MNARVGIPLGWITLELISLCFLGCAKLAGTENTPDPNQVRMNSYGEEMRALEGYGLFGSQCPMGYFASPLPGRVEFVSPPILPIALRLSKPLDELIFQADCAKKTIDIRGIERGAPASTWEFTPNGEFSVRVQGGEIEFEKDLSSTAHCKTPSVILIDGRVNCKSPDYPTIQLIAVNWALGRRISDYDPPETTPSPSPLPSPAPEVSPSPTPRTSPSPQTNQKPCDFPKGSYIQIPEQISIEQCHS